MNVGKIYAKYKVRTVKNTIFDPIRQIYLRLTPEEIVRQKTVTFLINGLEVPQNKILIERSLGTLGVAGSRKRIDIGILDDEGLLMGIVECKASLVCNDEAACLQAQNYLRGLHARYFFVTDGFIFNGYYYDKLQFVRLEEIPRYNMWKDYPTVK